jgi:hypothetical protein
VHQRRQGNTSPCMHAVATRQEEHAAAAPVGQHADRSGEADYVVIGSGIGGGCGRAGAERLAGAMVGAQVGGANRGAGRWDGRPTPACSTSRRRGACCHWLVREDTVQRRTLGLRQALAPSPGHPPTSQRWEAGDKGREHTGHGAPPHRDKGACQLAAPPALLIASPSMLVLQPHAPNTRCAGLCCAALLAKYGYSVTVGGSPRGWDAHVGPGLT